MLTDTSVKLPWKFSEIFGNSTYVVNSNQLGYSFLVSLRLKMENVADYMLAPDTDWIANNFVRGAQELKEAV